MDPDPVAVALADTFAQAILYAQASEALAAAMGLASACATQLGRVCELDPALGPEMQSSLEALHALVESMSGAVLFVQTRYEVSYEKLGKAQQEG